jgi:hypothetical protein
MELTRWELTEVELRVRHAVEAGQLVDLRVAGLEHNEPAQATTSTATPTIRARLVMELLTRPISADGASPRGVKLRGAHITGLLDLSLMTLTCPLLLQDCYLDEPINLREAQAPAIRLLGCHIPGLTKANVSKWTVQAVM